MHPWKKYWLSKVKYFLWPSGGGGPVAFLLPAWRMTLELGRGTQASSAFSPSVHLHRERRTVITPEIGRRNGLREGSLLLPATSLPAHLEEAPRVFLRSPSLLRSPLATLPASPRNSEIRSRLRHTGAPRGWRKGQVGSKGARTCPTVHSEWRTEPSLSLDLDLVLAPLVSSLELCESSRAEGRGMQG